MSEDPVPYTAVLPDAPALHPWLAAFRPQDQPMIRAWFSYAVSQGARRPEAVVEMVQRVVSAKLAWSVSPTSTQLCETTLAAHELHRVLAMDYARALLAVTTERR